MALPAFGLRPSFPQAGQVCCSTPQWGRMPEKSAWKFASQYRGPASLQLLYVYVRSRWRGWLNCLTPTTAVRGPLSGGDGQRTSSSSDVALSTLRWRERIACHSVASLP